MQYIDYKGNGNKMQLRRENFVIKRNKLTVFGGYGIIRNKGCPENTKIWDNIKICNVFVQR